eukprot:3781223-Pyramimonas_sp.AAC.1
MCIRDRFRGEAIHALVHLRGVAFLDEPSKLGLTPGPRPPRILDHPGASMTLYDPHHLLREPQEGAVAVSSLSNLDLALLDVRQVAPGPTGKSHEHQLRLLGLDVLQHFATLLGRPEVVAELQR